MKTERPFLGADLPSPSLGAQGGSKARSGTGATRSEASMARTHPRAPGDNRQRVAESGGFPLAKPPTTRRKRKQKSMPSLTLELDTQHGIYRERRIALLGEGEHAVRIEVRPFKLQQELAVDLCQRPLQHLQHRAPGGFSQTNVG